MASALLQHFFLPCSEQPSRVKQGVILLSHVLKQGLDEHLERFLEIPPAPSHRDDFGKQPKQTIPILSEQGQPWHPAGWHQPLVPPPCFRTSALVHLPNPELLWVIVSIPAFLESTCFPGNLS